MTLKTTIHAGIAFELAAQGDLQLTKSQESAPAPIFFPSGTGVGQATKVFSDTRTLALSATENLDLSGVLLDPQNVVLTFTAIKAIYVKAAAANTNNVVVGGGTNPFLLFSDPTDKFAVPPGGVFEVVHPGAGWAVTAGTGDILLVANSGAGTGVTYDIVIVGV